MRRNLVKPREYAIMGKNAALRRESGETPSMDQSPALWEARAMLEEETPIGRLGQPSDIAEAVFYLASPASSFLTGQVIAPNGGLII